MRRFYNYFTFGLMKEFSSSLTAVLESGLFSKTGKEACRSRIHANIQPKREKIKQLKQNYKKIKDSNNKSGNSGKTRKFWINWTTFWMTGLSQDLPVESTANQGI